MKTIGIIAEYNPFHNGHAYQITELRKRTGADFVVIAMSGNFVQRGAPAIMDKSVRTKIALECGADLVLELPALYATASAEFFAMAGVTLLEKCGCIDGICFGAETDNLVLLSRLADILLAEPAAYQNALSSCLKAGMTFPSARAKAICQLCPDFSEDVSDILSSPNNILALEYLKALKRRKSMIQPYLLKREGAGYHDTALKPHTVSPFGEDTDDSRAASPTASATAIRNYLFKPSAFSANAAALAQAMPKAAFADLNDYFKIYSPMCADDFSSILGYQLLSDTKNQLSDTADITPAIANRIKNNLYDYRTFSQFCEKNKSRDVTYTRISRILLHRLLGIRTCDYKLGERVDYIPYLRILGFRQHAGKLLSMLKKSTAVPVISKLADTHDTLSADAQILLAIDIFAGELYRQVLLQKTSDSKDTKAMGSYSEYTQKIVIVP